MFKRIIYTLIIFTSSPLFLYAQDFWQRSTKKTGELEIHTWGYGDLVLRVLGGVSALINDSDTYYIIFGIFMLIGICFLFFDYIRPSAARGMDPLKMARWWLWLAIVYALVFKAQVTVFVEEHSPYIAGERMNLEAGVPQGSVWTKQVPWIIGYPLHVFTSMEFALSKEIEKYFYDDFSFTLGGNTPSSVGAQMSYTGSGFLSPLLVLNEMGSGTASFDPYLYMNMNSYIIDCVVPEILSGRINMEDLLVSDDLSSMLFNSGPGGLINPARVTKYMEPTTSSSGSIFRSNNNANSVSNIVSRSRSFSYLSCSDAGSNILGETNELAGSEGINLVSLITGIFDDGNNDSNNVNNALSSMLSNEYANFLGLAPEYLMDYQEGASQFFTQALIMNQFNEAYATWAAMNGIPKDALSVGVTRAQTMAKERMSFSAVMAARYFPVVKGIIMVIVIGFTPIIILMLLTPMFTKFLMGYFMALLWLSLWHVGAALLHSVIMFISSNYLTGLTNGTYNMLYKYAVDSNVLDYINMAGKLYWSVPTIALMVAGGFSMYVMNSLAHTLSESVDGATGSAAADTSVGNLSYGNVSANNMSGNKTNFARNFAMGSNFSATFGSDVAFRFNSERTTTGNQELSDGISGYGDVRALANGNKQVSNFTTDSLMKIQNGTMDANGRLQSGQVSAPTERATQDLAQMTNEDNLDYITGGNKISRITQATVSRGDIVYAEAFDEQGNKFIMEKGSDGQTHTNMVDDNNNIIASSTVGKGVTIAMDTDKNGENDTFIHGANINTTGQGENAVTVITGGFYDGKGNSAFDGMSNTKTVIDSSGKVIEANADKLAYDDNGNMAKFVYDGRQVVAYSTSAALGDAKYIYDTQGNLVSARSNATINQPIALGENYILKSGAIEYIGTGDNKSMIIKEGIILDKATNREYAVNATLNSNGESVNIQALRGDKKISENLDHDITSILREYFEDIKYNNPIHSNTNIVSNDARQWISETVGSYMDKALHDPNNIDMYAKQVGDFMARQSANNLMEGIKIQEAEEQSEGKSTDLQKSVEGGAKVNTGKIPVVGKFINVGGGGGISNRWSESDQEKYSSNTAHYQNESYNMIRDSVANTFKQSIDYIRDNDYLRSNTAAAREYLTKELLDTYGRTTAEIKAGKGVNPINNDTSPKIGMPGGSGISGEGTSTSDNFNIVDNYQKSNNTDFTRNAEKISEKLNTLDITPGSGGSGGSDIGSGKTGSTAGGSGINYGGAGNRSGGNPPSSSDIGVGGGLNNTGNIPGSGGAGSSGIGNTARSDSQPNSHGVERGNPFQVNQSTPTGKDSGNIFNTIKNRVNEKNQINQDVENMTQGGGKQHPSSPKSDTNKKQEGTGPSNPQSPGTRRVNRG